MGRREESAGLNSRRNSRESEQPVAEDAAAAAAARKRRTANGKRTEQGYIAVEREREDFASPAYDANAARPRFPRLIFWAVAPGSYSYNSMWQAEGRNEERMRQCRVCLVSHFFSSTHQLTWYFSETPSLSLGFVSLSLASVFLEITIRGATEMHGRVVHILIAKGLHCCRSIFMRMCNRRGGPLQCRRALANGYSLP